MTERWRVWGPAVVLAAVAVVQRARVDLQGLSAWKGGGMGMYSEFHWREREVWLHVPDDGRADEASFVGEAAMVSIEARAFECMLRASDDCLRDVAVEVQVDGVHGPFAVEVWSWDSSSAQGQLRLQRRRVRAAPIEGEPGE